MDPRFAAVARHVAEHLEVISLADLERIGVGPALRYDWVRSGLLVRLGRRSFTVAGTAPTWARSLAAGAADLHPHGLVAGRAAAQWYGLDGFDADALEYLVPRARRNLGTAGIVRSTIIPVPPTDTRQVNGLRCVTPERLILDAKLFRWTRAEVERAIDDALRRRWISESRLRRRVEERLAGRLRPGRRLVDALVDSGGESALERRFLALVRSAGLPRPTPQRVFRDGTTTIARVDFRFPNGLIVEVAGHASHSSRAHRNTDTVRSNELILRDEYVLSFTYEHVTRQPEYVLASIERAFNVLLARRVTPDRHSGDSR